MFYTQLNSIQLAISYYVPDWLDERASSRFEILSEFLHLFDFFSQPKCVTMDESREINQIRLYLDSGEINTAVDLIQDLIFFILFLSIQRYLFIEYDAFILNMFLISFSPCLTHSKFIDHHYYLFEFFFTFVWINSDM